jgi:hypothetical protein
MRRGIVVLAVAAVVYVGVMPSMSLDWHIVTLDWLKELEAAGRYDDPRYDDTPYAPMAAEVELVPVDQPVPVAVPPENVPGPEPVTPEAPSR